MTDHNLEIRELTANDNIPYDLLYSADPYKDAAEYYPNRKTCNIAFITAH